MSKELEAEVKTGNDLSYKLAKHLHSMNADSIFGEEVIDNCKYLVEVSFIEKMNN